MAVRLRTGEMVAEDVGPRADTSLERLARLAPVLDKGTVTAGNASGISDGAAAVVVMNDAALAQSGARPLARILGASCVGVDPTRMGLAPSSPSASFWPSISLPSAILPIGRSTRLLPARSSPCCAGWGSNRPRSIRMAALWRSVTRLALAAPASSAIWPGVSQGRTRRARRCQPMRRRRHGDGRPSGGRSHDSKRRKSKVRSPLLDDAEVGEAWTLSEQAYRIIRAAILNAAFRRVPSSTNGL